MITEEARTIHTQVRQMPSIMLNCGARNFRAGENFLMFNVAKGKSNNIKIILQPSDTYTVQYLKTHNYKTRIVEEWEDVYVDMLERIVYEMVNK